MIPIRQPTRTVSGSDKPATRLMQAFSDASLKAADWPSRAAALDLLAAAGLNTTCTALNTLLTFALEHLHETAITGIDAALIYALTSHEEWREAALQFLRMQNKAEVTAAKRKIPSLLFMTNLAEASGRQEQTSH
jgi:hypothetical protein